MNKLLFILLILFSSCEKDNSNDTFCWTCTQTTIISFIDYSTGSPVTNPDIDITTQLITICDANIDSIKTFIAKHTGIDRYEYPNNIILVHDYTTIYEK